MHAIKQVRYGNIAYGCAHRRVERSADGRSFFPDEFAWDRVLRMQIFRIYAMEIAGLKEERRIRIIQFAI